MGTCGGPNSQEQASQAQEASFSRLLNANYASRFGAQSSIFNTITGILQPIAEAGPGQEGMTPAEKAARTSQAINANATNYRNASTVVAGARAQAGGNTFAPTGGDKEVQAEIASGAAGQLSNAENDITKEDYALGRSNYEQAIAGLSGVAAEENPSAIGSEENAANSETFNEASKEEEQSSAWMGELGGLVGGLGSAAIGAFGPHK
jgi:hypothetical protein